MKIEYWKFPGLDPETLSPWNEGEETEGFWIIKVCETKTVVTAEGYNFGPEFPPFKLEGPADETETFGIAGALIAAFAAYWDLIAS